MDTETLVTEATEFYRNSQLGRTLQIRNALNCADSLLNLQDALEAQDAPVGTFGEKLKAIGIPARTARHWMRIARAGWTFEDVLTAGSLRKAYLAIKAYDTEQADDDGTERQRGRADPAYPNTDYCDSGAGWDTGAYEPATVADTLATVAAQMQTPVERPPRGPSKAEILAEELEQERREKAELYARIERLERAVRAQGSPEPVITELETTLEGLRETNRQLQYENEALKRRDYSYKQRIKELTGV